jgi:hypothetical protein
MSPEKAQIWGKIKNLTKINNLDFCDKSWITSLIDEALKYRVYEFYGHTTYFGGVRMF